MENIISKKIATGKVGPGLSEALSRKGRGAPTPLLVAPNLVGPDVLRALSRAEARWPLIGSVTKRYPQYRKKIKAQAKAKPAAPKATIREPKGTSVSYNTICLLRHLSSRRTAANDRSEPETPGAVPVIADNRPLDQRCEAAWRNNKALRAEFSDDFESYLAYENAVARGWVRIVGRVI